MPLANPNSLVEQTISYDAWTPSAGNNLVRYFEYPSATKYLAAYGKLGVVLIADIREATDITDFEANYKPSALSVTTEAELYELCSLDAMIGNLDGRQQKAFEFSSTIIYMGYADFGIAQSNTGWTIKRLNLDTNGNPTNEQWTAVNSGTWDNRTSENYF